MFRVTDRCISWPVGLPVRPSVCVSSESSTFQHRLLAGCGREGQGVRLPLRQVHHRPDCRRRRHRKPDRLDDREYRWRRLARFASRHDSARFDGGARLEDDFNTLLKNAI